ncbi:hypothetical protein Y032_0095g2785 [Ancylostoma ceylanicum]|uniref:Clc-like protein n=1 Tax=Ancylostoma ceylanicum TaxID=53326 RepID=A0A016TJK5_9BILA|nr:hypothetical protein Y032_0095g2785 [Ancylostoma ceylanicum]
MQGGPSDPQRQLPRKKAGRCQALIDAVGLRVNFCPSFWLTLETDDRGFVICNNNLYENTLARENVDVCRFLLIGDCRKKLLRTPYFFGWHYAVLILNIVSICLISCGIAAAAWQYKNRERSRLSTILFSAFICMAVLTLGISLMVFVINGEMLESKYLIGVKNTFEKYYGYSFYLACTALVMLVFAAFGAILMTTFTFFGSGRSTDTAQRHISSVTSDYNEEIRKSPQQDVLMNVSHGGYIQPSRSPNGQFQQTTRHFYSY